MILVGGALLAPAMAGAQPGTASRISAEQRQSRYQIGQMERVLEGAVEHGAAVTRDRLQAVLPPNQTSMSGENAQARGFRLEGYGVIFDVIVPPFYTESTLAWTMRTLDQNNLGLQSALNQLRAKAAGDADAEQALRRIELQMGPAVLPRPTTPPGARDATGSVSNAGGSGTDARVVSAASTRPAAAGANSQTPAVDPILEDPSEAYRTEVTQALKDAMLDHSASLGIGQDEWLTIAAKGNDDRPRLAPADSDSATRIIRLRGSDLAAYLARQITRDEALRRIEVRVF